MTVGEFCLNETQVGELVAILVDGWIACTTWINAENLFILDTQIDCKHVVRAEWGYIKITDKNGENVEIPCHKVYT